MQGPGQVDVPVPVHKCSSPRTALFSPPPVPPLFVSLPRSAIANAEDRCCCPGAISQLWSGWGGGGGGGKKINESFHPLAFAGFASKMQCVSRLAAVCQRSKPLRSTGNTREKGTLTTTVTAGHKTKRTIGRRPKKEFDLPLTQ